MNPKMSNMKKYLLSLLVLTGFFLSLSAQQIDECEVAPIYQDTSAGVYPLPFDADLNPDGGITDTACLNEYFQFVFTVVVGDTISIGGTSIPIDSVVLDADAISNLPEGMSYTCNPGSCSFAAGDAGCVVIYGKATNASDVGAHDLVISGKLYSPFTPTGAPLQFPNPDLAPGSYTLYVQEQGSPNCSIWVDVNEPVSQIESFRNLPNPFNGTTTLEIITKEAGAYNFTLYSLLGEPLQTRTLQLTEGLNQWTFDAGQLPDGMYIYTLSDGHTQVSGRMVLER